MNIEITGVSPVNKGALLMLEAVRARLSEAFPKARFAVPFAWPAEARLASGVWATPSRAPRRRPDLSTVLEHVPARVRHNVGFLSGQEIDVLLDASGFGYGDFWGLPKLQHRLTRRLAHWKTGRRAAVLLPQALGPFEGPGMAEAFRAALSYLDLAFVRDSASQAYVEAVAPEAPNVRRAPDFTNLLHPDLPERLHAVRGKAILIPNEKVVTDRPDELRAAYFRFLQASAQRLQASGRELVILVHEGAADRRLAEELNAQLDRPAQIVDEPSALVTKAVIAAADVIVSSRFHGLVSALSSGVPALACGWSHKYDELLADYGCRQYSVRLDDLGAATERLDALLKDAENSSYRASLSEAAAGQRRLSEAMWADVEAVIRRSAA